MKQRQKPHRNKELYHAMQELRRSSATTPIPSKSRYRREKSGNQSWKKDY